MRGNKKKLIQELETELEQLIGNSGRSEVDIRTDYNALLEENHSFSLAALPISLYRIYI